MRRQGRPSSRGLATQRVTENSFSGPFRFLFVSSFRRSAVVTPQNKRITAFALRMIRALFGRAGAASRRATSIRQIPGNRVVRTPVFLYVHCIFAAHFLELRPGWRLDESFLKGVVTSSHRFYLTWLVRHIIIIISVSFSRSSFPDHCPADMRPLPAACSIFGTGCFPFIYM